MTRIESNSTAGRLDTLPEAGSQTNEQAGHAGGHYNGTYVAATRGTGAPTSLVPPTIRTRTPASADSDPRGLSRLVRRLRHLAGFADRHAEQGLIGASIAPSTASRHLHRIEFDGFGRIVRFKRPLRDSAAKLLESAQIAPLAQTNSPHAREAARSARDCLTQLLHLAVKLDDAGPTGLADAARDLWLSGQVGRDETKALLNQALAGFCDDEEVSALLLELHAEVDEDKSTAQLNDNLYGRHFDSEFARELVARPPTSVLLHSKRTGQALHQLFLDTVGPAGIVRSDTLQALADLMRDDRRPWFRELPDVGAFMREPTEAHLHPLLTRVESGFDAIKIPYVAVRLSFSIQSMLGMPPWMRAANENFAHVVGPERSPVPAPVAHRTRRDGIRLHYQPGSNGHLNGEVSKSWADDKVLDATRVGAFDQRALDAGQPIVNGASGSANILAFLHRHLAARDPEHDESVGMLAALMFLAYDGGHSINEVLGVYQSIRQAEARTHEEHPPKLHRGTSEITAAESESDSGSGMPPDFSARMATFEARRQHLVNYRLDYASVASLAGEGDDRSTVVGALESALSKTVDHFEKHSHFAARNLALIAQRRKP